MRLSIALAAVALAPLASAQSDSLTTVVQTLDEGIRIHLVSGPAPQRSACNEWYGEGDDSGDTPERAFLEGWIDRYGERLDLDVSCMADSMGPHLYNVEVRPILGTNNMVVNGTYSDGAGTTVVEWLVGPRGTVRTKLISGPDLFEQDNATIHIRELRLGLEAIVASQSDLEDAKAEEILELVLVEAEHLLEVLDQLTEELGDM